MRRKFIKNKLIKSNIPHMAKDDGPNNKQQFRMQNIECFSSAIQQELLTFVAAAFIP